MSDTLYLLPGLLCDARVWTHQQQQLADLVDIRIPDFRDCDSLDAMADVVLADAPERFYLAGHSMGGRVAMQILGRVPQRIISIGLLDTGVHAVKEGEQQKRFALVDLAAEKGMREMAKQWTPPMVHPDHQQDAALMEEIFDMVAGYSVEQFRNQQTALLGRPDARPFLALAPPGSLVLCGRQDVWSPPAQHQDIINALPDKPELIVIEDSGHMSTMEQPAAVSAAMRHWLQQSIH